MRKRWTKLFPDERDEMGKHSKKKVGHAGPPVSPQSSPEAQGVGWGILGLWGLLGDFKRAFDPHSPEKWYDRVLHVIGALIVLGLLGWGLVNADS
jgi:hypothetical protein